MNTLIGIVVFLLFLTCIVAMIVNQVEMVKADAKKEERDKARHEALIWAEEKYRRMMKNTEFRVTQSVVFSNESDIKW